MFQSFLFHHFCFLFGNWRDVHVVVPQGASPSCCVGIPGGCRELIKFDWGELFFHVFAHFGGNFKLWVSNISDQFSSRVNEDS